MAVIANSSQKMDVTGKGKALDASVNLSGALMEMLSTVYKYILMAGIREAIQNACDAARRNGHSFADGVTVLLPTPTNPMITVIDKGTGMTQEFMEHPRDGYLSFGHSTKRGDDGSAGGLGVGRWAAYGYIRECFIATCHESDMVQRTYFQFQSPAATPQVQLASEVPGVVVGTKVYFPVKESDIGEALRAVSWLKEVMQLTMGDSFSVDSPALLPSVLPASSDIVLDLGLEDATLAGVKVYPMQGEALQYGRESLQKGSLVVMTNKAAGVGGLPFHVQSTVEDSVFSCGMLVEIPMAFRVPFMPSREEIKYTDEVSSLMRSIDQAARKAILRVAGKLFDEPTLSSKIQLTKLFGTTEAWNFFCRAARAETSLTKDLHAVMGNRKWDGSMRMPAVPEVRARDLTCKYLGSKFQPVTLLAGELAISTGKDSTSAISFSAARMLRIVINDVKSGGVTRFHRWASDSKDVFIYLSHKSDITKAEAAANAMSATYGGELDIVRVSSMPDFERSVVGSKIVAKKLSGGGGLTFHCFIHKKMMSTTAGLTDLDDNEKRKVWIGKQGGQLGGFTEESSLTDLAGSGAPHPLKHVMDVCRVRRLYLLTPKQEVELNELITTLKGDGLWDLSADELAELEDEDLVAAVKGAKCWTTLEDYAGEVLLHPNVQEVAAHRTMQWVTDNTFFSAIMMALAKRPRLELTKTRFDKAVTPFIDVVTGKLNVHRSAGVNTGVRDICQSLSKIGRSMLVTSDDSKERQALSKALVDLQTAGTIDYSKELAKLCEAFPLLATLKAAVFTDEQADDLAKALAVLYR